MAETQKYTSTAPRPDGSQIDWHDYIVIEDHFMPEEREMIETSLNQLVQIPKFQEILIRTQSKEVMEAWQKLVNVMPEYLPPSELSDDIVEDHFYHRLIHRKDTKIHIAQDSRENKPSCFYSPLRTVLLNLKELQHVYFKDQDGELYRPTLQHWMAHELTHAARANDYDITASGQKVARKARQQCIAAGKYSGDLLTEIDNLCRLAFTLKSEPYVIEETNQITPHFGEPPRGEYGDDKVTRLPHPQIMGEFIPQAVIARVIPTKQPRGISGYLVETVGSKMIEDHLSGEKEATEEAVPKTKEPPTPNYNPDEIEWSKKDFVQKSDKPIIR